MVTPPPHWIHPRWQPSSAVLWACPENGSSFSPLKQARRSKILETESGLLSTRMHGDNGGSLLTPAPPRGFAFPPADRDQQARESKYAREKPGQVLVGRKNPDGRRQQDEIPAQNKPALPRRRRPPTPSVGLCGEPVSGSVRGSFSGAGHLGFLVGVTLSRSPQGDVAPSTAPRVKLGFHLPADQPCAAGRSWSPASHTRWAPWTRAGCRFRNLRPTG